MMNYLKIQWNLEKVKYNPMKEFDSEPVYNEKYLKAKIKYHSVNSEENFDEEN